MPTQPAVQPSSPARGPDTEDLHVRAVEPLVTPHELKALHPALPTTQAVVHGARETIRQILDRRDRRMLLVVGPCSIHASDVALDFAQRLARLRPQIEDRFFVVMRVYFEKPRTTVGWKGFINDPRLDNSCDMGHGLDQARKLMTDILGLGLPIATEFLDPIVPQYIADLVSWAAIGARTTESQTHRELASGLSMPVGFKNGTDGRVQTAIDALRSACIPHHFLGIDAQGKTSIVRTSGNPSGHVVLRGGSQGPNYSREHIAETEALLRKAGLPPAVMVDCSHANSGKDPARQPLVWRDLLDQRRDPDCPIIGGMLESNIHPGAQPLNDPADLAYGVSITDACMGWEETEALLLER